MSIRARVYRLLNIVVLLSLPLTPAQPLVGAGLAPARASPVGRVDNSFYQVLATGLFRTRVTVRTPADWARLEGLGVVVLAGNKAADIKDVPHSPSAGSGQSTPALSPDRLRGHPVGATNEHRRGTASQYSTP